MTKSYSTTHACTTLDMLLITHSCSTAASMTHYLPGEKIQPRGQAAQPVRATMAGER
jgi:hypothetical protein